MNRCWDVWKCYVNAFFLVVFKHCLSLLLKLNLYTSWYGPIFLNPQGYWGTPFSHLCLFWKHLRSYTIAASGFVATMLLFYENLVQVYFLLIISGCHYFLLLVCQACALYNNWWPMLSGGWFYYKVVVLLLY